MCRKLRKYVYQKNEDLNRVRGEAQYFLVFSRSIYDRPCLSIILDISIKPMNSSPTLCILFCVYKCNKSIKCQLSVVNLPICSTARTNWWPFSSICMFLLHLSNSMNEGWMACFLFKWHVYTEWNKLQCEVYWMATISLIKSSARTIAISL